MATSGINKSRAGGCRVVVSNSFELTHRQNATNKIWKRIVDEECGAALCIDTIGVASYKLETLRLDATFPKTCTVEWGSTKWHQVP